MIIKIGTRGSPLARAQAQEVRARLIAAHSSFAEDGAIHIEIIKTSGDKFIESSLEEIGGKGLFTKEIEDALLEKKIDIAVHSMKDMPTALPSGLIVDCILPREDPRDVLISQNGGGIKNMPIGAKVGTASLRRRSQLLRLRPDLKISLLRGNINTRLLKVEKEEIQGTLLAYAGLKRLNKYKNKWSILSSNEMLPAVGQGAIGIERRIEDQSIAEILEPLNCPTSNSRVVAERSLLSELDGSCRMPIAGLAELIDGSFLKLRGLISDSDGVICHEMECSSAINDASFLGKEVGAKLKALRGNNFNG